MDIFLGLLIFGTLGMLMMVLMGRVHVGGHGFLGHGAHGAHGGAHGGHALPQHGQGAHAAGHGGHFSARSLLSISLIDIFAFCIGAGLVGLLIKPIVGGILLALAAIAGALIFDIGLVRSIAAFLQKWSATPSEGLEGSIATSGEAMTNFDAKGQGVIRLTLDGQIVQVLACLQDSELKSGVRVKKGDQLVVLQVDSTKNKCFVTRELAQEAGESPL